MGQLAVLALVVLGFGGTMYALVRQSVYREAEADLLGAAQLIAQDLQNGRPGDRAEITRAYRHRFGPAPRDHAYFAIWTPRGELIGGSDPLPPHVHPLDQPPPEKGPRPFVAQTHGPDLELIVRGPHGEQILVGRPLAKEQDRLGRLLFTLCVVGALALGLGGVAAWWLARRIVRPLEKLTETAEQISARRLDQRLEIEPTSAELTRLSSVFNRMLDRLQASFAQQIRFTADASHELRTPVAVILTQAEHSLARPRESDEYRGALDTCLRAARRMKRLVDDLLVLARADSGRLEMKPEACDLAEVARSALVWLEPLAVENGVRLASQLQSTPIHCDPAQIAQVITNLVSNAIEYNRAGGEVFVTVHPKSQRGALTVADTGIGIPKEDHVRIFERFYRADKARTQRAGHGTGLGLSIVAEIVAGHGGTVEVISTSEQGTTFTVELPLEAPAEGIEPL
jgi:heavy metal sensor kinase